MDPKELQNFERQPAFGIYPPGQKDPLPDHIKKIRDKWARLRVDLSAVWRIIRMGYNISEENNVIDPATPYNLTPRYRARGDYNKRFLDSLSLHMKALVKKIRNDKRTQEQKDSDRKILVAHCGKWTDESGPVDAFESFCETVRRRDPLLDRVPLPDPRKRERGRPTEVVGPATYFIASLLKLSLTSKKGPKSRRFYWGEIGELLSFYYPWETHLTNDDLKNFYNHHLKAGIPSDWPTLKVLLKPSQKKK